jgi:putative FmdB family regulatory protein
MPIYEYRCASCGHELEALQKFSDALLAQCPSCHGAHLKKKVSAAGFHLKGSGWYATDFRNSGAKPPPKDAAKDGAAKDGAAKKANGGDGKSETKSGDGSASESAPAVPAPARPSEGASESKPAATASSDKTNP